MTNSTSNISLNLIPANVPSLCIPRVFSNIPRDRIFRIVDDLGLGRILGIDMVPKVSEKGEKYNRIFIHFTAWSTSKDAEKARQIALSGGEFKILYDDPYFWKVSASTSTTPFAPTVAATPKSANSSRPKLAFEDSSDRGQREQQKQQEYQQKHQYPSPESRREKYGPRPVTEPRQEQRPIPRRQQDQRPRRQEYQRQEYQRQDQRQDHPQSKEDNAVANVNAAANLLDKLALDMQEDEPQDIKLTLSQLNSFYINDTVLLPPVRRRGKGPNKYPKKESKVVEAKVVAVMIEVEDGLEEGEEVEEVEIKVEKNA